MNKKTYFFHFEDERKVLRFRTEEHESDEAAAAKAKDEPNVTKVVAADGSAEIYKREEAK